MYIVYHKFNKSLITMELVERQFYFREAVIYRYIPSPRQFYTGKKLPPAVLFRGQ